MVGVGPRRLNVAALALYGPTMTLDELALSLPNGFHDAELEVVTIDCTKREARLTLDVWIGDDDEREAYRRAELTLTGLLYWVSEPAASGDPYGVPGAVTIDVGPLEQLHSANCPKLPQTPASAFSNWVFVNDWNAFIYVAAENSSLKWIGERTIR